MAGCAGIIGKKAERSNEMEEVSTIKESQVIESLNRIQLKPRIAIGISAVHSFDASFDLTENLRWIPYWVFIL